MATQMEVAYQAPPSPTLTNPDMILPDMDYDQSTSNDRSDALMAWKNAQVGDMPFALPESQYFNLGINVGSGISPATPIIYGNGTMLSDIGEVTEVESTVGRSSPPASPIVTPRMTSRAALRAGALDAVVNSAAYQSIKAKARLAHERRNSSDSTSTITTNEHHGLFEDFDDSISVGDSNFQGDDEESVAESYSADPMLRNVLLATGRRNLTVDPNDEDRLSTISIGRRAEEILANAKRRLTSMEGNLNRARSSLYVGTETPVDSEGSVTPSPPLKMSHAIDPMSPPVDYNGHSRIDSDQASIDTTNTHTRRSASAFGAAGGYRHIVNRRNSNDTLHRITPKRDSSESFQGVPMDDTMSIGSRRNSGQADGLLSPTHFQFPDRGLSRSTSAMQVLDIKDQVKDLKGKVSALREQARADSLKRQSLQSLRTPSPFTYAVVDQWYAEPKTTSGTEKSEGIVQDETTIQTGDENHSNEPQTPAGTSSQNHAWSGEVLISSDEEMSPVELEHGSICGNDVNDADSTTSSKYEDAERSMTPVNRSVTPPGGPDSHMFQEIIKHRLQNEIDDDMRTEDGYEDATAITDYDSDSGDSMYHDAPLPLSHEDREDAFDYEHFFLHSAMGTIRQQRLERERRGSFSSEDSVETTRGPMHTQTINRRNSADSISTMASFETADEGRHSRLTRNNSSDSASGSGGGSGIAGAPRSNSTSAKNRPGHASHMSLDTFVSAQEAHDRSSPTKTRRGVSSFRTNAGSDIPRSVSAMSSSNPALRGPMIRRPVSTSTFRHRPSTSSFDSTGTNRSFPLVSKKRLSLTLPSATSNRGPYAGIPTPGDSPNTEGEEDRDDLSDIREQLTSDATSTAARQGLPGQNGTYTPPRINDSQMSTTASMAMLQRDDQMLVEQLVASLGQCVLKLSEVDRTSTDSRVLRQRMAAARRLLEGLDEPHASWEPTSLV
ncbi:hypothetical protein BROUX41_000591 [Berkeleyomyces rouxiae]|uniref:uncharacterized protein n=1 Tax=Berkeleyomyces rouxiae TaxID=2035830 RepID=UPI003B7F7FEE